MKKCLVLIAALLLAAPAIAQQPMSIRDFRDAYVAALKKAAPDFAIETVDDSIVKYGKDKPPQSVAYMDRAYNDYRLDPSQRDNLIGDLVKMSLRAESGDMEAVKRDALVVMLRTLDYAQGAPSGAAAEIIMRPFAGDLGMILMRDTPDALGTVGRSALKELGLSEDEAFAQAYKNLPVRLGKPHIETMNGFRYINAESGLAVGMLAAPGACAADKRDERVVFVADRSYYIEADLSNAQGVAAVRNVARGMIRDGASLSSTLIQCKDGKWSQIPLN